MSVVVTGGDDKRCTVHSISLDVIMTNVGHTRGMIQWLTIMVTIAKYERDASANVVR